MSSNNKVILITGTPGTGKTTIANQLNNYLSHYSNSKLIKINEFAIKNNLIDGEDIEKGYKIINLSRLDKKLNEDIENFFPNLTNNVTTNNITTNNVIDTNNNNTNNNNINNINDNYNSKIVIVEGHLSHFCSLGGNVDKVIVLRLNPQFLEERLKSRNYDNIKIYENLEAEALGVCSVEAYEKHGNKVNEIDTSNLSIKDVLNLVKDIVNNKKEYPVGNVDFISWILD